MFDDQPTAIVSGSTGLIGPALCSHLQENGYRVLCLARKQRTYEETIKLFGQKVNYLAIPLEQLSLEVNVEKLINWTKNSHPIFFNLAWQGFSKLTDGSIEDQVNNVHLCANAVKVAQSIGCQKFINVGTIQETYFEQFLDSKSSEIQKNGQSEYTIAKIAARDMCKIQAYFSKIDFIHTRLSVPIDFSLKSAGYIANTLKQILAKQDYTPPRNPQLYDLVSLDDVATGLRLLGEYGHNKFDYYIGPANPINLSALFEYFVDVVNAGTLANQYEPIDLRISTIFDNSLLLNHTGFCPLDTFHSIVKKSTFS